jgi:hypothetical protein
MLFLNSWRASATLYSATTHPPAIQKQHWQSREAQIELPLIECEWAFRIRRLIKGAWQSSYDSCLITEHSYSYPMERLVWGLSHGPHSVNIPCGRKPEYQEKPTTFGRALSSENQTHDLTRERRLLWRLQHQSYNLFSSEKARALPKGHGFLKVLPIYSGLPFSEQV